METTPIVEPSTRAGSEHHTALPPCRSVVAVVLLWRGRVGLFKRSQAVSHDAGLWHCITGFVDRQERARTQAIEELFEETGVGVADLSGFVTGPVLHLLDPSGEEWTVHTFRAETTRRRLSLNWEHDAYRWVNPRLLAGFDGQVSWLRDVVAGIAGGDSDPAS